MKRKRRLKRLKINELFEFTKLNNDIVALEKIPFNIAFLTLTLKLL